MLPSLVLGALVLVPGIPLALVVGRGAPARAADGADATASRRWSSVVVEGLVLGLVWWLLFALWFSHAHGWFTPWRLALATLAVVAALAVPAVREARTIERPVATWFAGFMVVVIGIAVALRVEPFYFLYQIGDFGEYVSRANSVADGGIFSGWFTQGFTVALALTHLALGEASTVELMPFLGVVLLFVVVEIAARLGASVWARGVVAVILAVGVVPVWFSRFPASETLYAVLQVGMVLLVLVAVQRTSMRLAVAAGIVCGFLLVIRGNGLLLGPIVVVFLGVNALVVRRRTIDVLAAFSGAALLSLGAAFVFNARFSHPYFIAEQLPKYVPKVVFRQLEGMGELSFAAPRLLVLVAVTAGIVWVARWLNARVSPSVVAQRFALPTLIAVGVLALLTVEESAGLTDALARYEIVVELLGALGIGVALWRFAHAMDDGERVAVTLVVLLGGAFALLYAHRLPTPRYAPYYLYWDRYLFSELFPVMVLAVIWAIALLERVRVPGPLIGLGAVLLGLLLHADASITREHRFMDDAYEQLRSVDRLAADDERPLVFSGILEEEMPPTLYHPNTHRVVASPLIATFERRFLNLGLHPYAPDPRPDASAIAAAMRRGGHDEAYLVQVSAGDEPPPPVDVDGHALEVERVGQTTIDIPMLDRPLDRSEPRWSIPRFTIVVSSVTLL